MTEALAPIGRLYDPRSYEGIDRAVAVLGAESSHPLDEAGKAFVLDFRADLQAGSVEQQNGNVLHAQPGGEHLSLGDVLKEYRYAGDRFEVSCDYFMTEEGRNLLKEHGFAEASKSTSTNQVRKFFLTNSQGMDKDSLKSMAEKSKSAVDATIAHALADGKDIQPPDRVVVFQDATKLFRKLRSLREYKAFYKQVRKQLDGIVSPDTDETTRAACLMMLDLYQKEVNGELAATFPDAFHYLEQVDHMNERERTIGRSALEHLLPNIIKPKRDYHSMRIGRFMMRLDRVRNGATKLPDSGRYDAISPELEQYLEQQQDQEIEGTPEFTEEETAVLDGVYFNDGQIKAFAEELLDSLGLLSAYPAEEGDHLRTHRAADGKWQVYIRKGYTSLTADDPQGLLQIGKGIRRSLTKITAPAGVVPVLVHELYHVIQDNNNAQSPGSGIGREVHGRGYLALRETGAINAERWAQQRFFGRQRKESPHYMRALAALERGANEVEAAKVFFDSYIADNPDEPRLEAAKVAVSRTMRLARRQGGFDSQPLDYSEAGLILEKTKHLPQHIQSTLFDSGAFSLEDLAALHQFGLLTLPKERFPYDQIVAIVTTKLRNIIDEQRQKHDR